MAVAPLDLPQLASFCSVPESSISTLLDQPTTQLVQDFLSAVAARVQDFNELNSAKLKSDVELENAIRSGESKARLLKGSADKAQKEAAEAKQSLQLAG